MDEWEITEDKFLKDKGYSYSRFLIRHNKCKNFPTILTIVKRCWKCNKFVPETIVHKVRMLRKLEKADYLLSSGERQK